MKWGTNQGCHDNDSSITLFFVWDEGYHVIFIFERKNGASYFTVFSVYEQVYLVFRNFLFIFSQSPNHSYTMVPSSTQSGNDAK